MPSVAIHKERLFCFAALVVALLLATALSALPAQQAYANDLAAACGVSAQASGETVNVDVEVTYGQTEARSMLAMINDFRTGSDAWAWNESDTSKIQYSGLGNLVYDYELERVAMYRAAELALSFSHVMLDGSSYAYTMIQGTNYGWGENIAAGQRSAAEAFEAWQETNDPYDGQGHRRNMLSSDFACVGIGHVVCNGVDYWVQEFADPSVNTNAVAALDSSRVVSLSVASSLITERDAAASVKEMKLLVGEQADCPTATASIVTARTWGGAVPVVSDVAWQIADESVAKLVDGKVVGLRAGKTTLRGTLTVLGAQVNVPITVEKRANSLTVKAKSVSAKAGKKKTLKAKKAFRVSGAQGKVTYKVSKYDKKAKKKITVSKSGKVTVKKGLAKGTYKLKVKVTAAGNATHAAGSKTVTLKVKVK